MHSYSPNERFHLIKFQVAKSPVGVDSSAVSKKLQASRIKLNSLLIFTLQKRNFMKNSLLIHTQQLAEKEKVQ